MPWVFAFLGMVVGAFLNNAADYLPAGRSALEVPRCPYCGQPRNLLEWSVVVSALTLRGRCHRCGAPFLWRSILVELGTAVLFIFLAWWYGPTSRLIEGLVYTAVLVLTVVTDIEHRRILNAVIAPAAVFAFGIGLVEPTPGPVWVVVGGAVGLAIFLAMYLAYPRGLGMGDVKLAGLIGLMVGFPNVIIALVLGVLLGGAGAFTLLLLRRVGLKSHIPYGPFIAIGGWVALVWGSQIAARWS
jgi:prepilin signal peptidase PulO-like enzyme (type II secretory pathway)